MTAARVRPDGPAAWGNAGGAGGGGARFGIPHPRGGLSGAGPKHVLRLAVAPRTRRAVPSNHRFPTTLPNPGAPMTSRPTAPRPPAARRRARRGFSLLELIAVVTILGIIAAVVIPRITNSSVEASRKADQQTAAEIRSAIERHYFETGAYPATINELQSDGYLHSEPSFSYFTATSSGSPNHQYDSGTGALTLAES